MSIKNAVMNVKADVEGAPEQSTTYVSQLKTQSPLK
jgi:hypothetical protein